MGAQEDVGGEVERVLQHPRGVARRVVEGGEVVVVELDLGPLRHAEAEAQERSEEHTSELQSRQYLVCRLLLEKKKHRRPLHLRAPAPLSPDLSAPPHRHQHDHPRPGYCSTTYSLYSLADVLLTLCFTPRRCRV